MTGWKKEKKPSAPKGRIEAAFASIRFDSIDPRVRFETAGIARAIFRKCNDWTLQGDNPRYRSQVYNRALLPPGQGFKMRIATNPRLHGVRKDVRMPSVCVWIWARALSFKYNLSIREHSALNSDFYTHLSTKLCSHGLMVDTEFPETAHG